MDGWMDGGMVKDKVRFQLKVGSVDGGLCVIGVVLCLFGVWRVMCDGVD